MPTIRILSERPGALRAAMPDTLRPALAYPARQAPDGDRWLHEVKLDGYRMLCRLAGDRVKFISRHGLDWTDRLEPVALAVQDVPARRAILDGEIVVHASDGTTDIRALRRGLGQGHGSEIVYYVFDVIYLDGYDLTRVPLEQRKELLSRLVAPSEATGRLRLSQPIIGHGPEVFRQACRLGVEGIVSKRCDSQYPCGRSRSWLKVKCPPTEWCVTGGDTN